MSGRTRIWQASTFSIRHTQAYPLRCEGTASGQTRQAPDDAGQRGGADHDGTKPLRALANSSHHATLWGEARRRETGAGGRGGRWRVKCPPALCDAHLCWALFISVMAKLGNEEEATPPPPLLRARIGRGHGIRTQAERGCTARALSTRQYALTLLISG